MRSLPTLFAISAAVVLASAAPRPGTATVTTVSATGTASATIRTVAATTAPPRAAQPLLRLSSRGAAVVTLQQRLSELRYVDVGVADGVFGSATLHAVVAFQKVQGISRDGVVGPVTWARLAAPYRPAPRYRLGTSSLEVDLTRQVVYYVRSGSVQAIADASTGSGGTYYSQGRWSRAVTPTGRFAIYARYSGWQNSPLGWMYRPNYFYGGYAVHGSTSVPPYPASHGCVRVTVSTMDRLSPMLWMGMPVAVYR